ncbi:hypothetical protein BDV96DRAFT_694550 [Lophiotrema nucula]|uniref:Uncharacterized protein n=1 Tax=Lophiotrema nucula TaxID=690887 RepID=A0A6A5YI88_9PLEO|nr:hypothetical protein BDV96DRAFT_694550 [Lophiotrema nucula]
MKSFMNTVDNRQARNWRVFPNKVDTKLMKGMKSYLSDKRFKQALGLEVGISHTSDAFWFIHTANEIKDFQKPKPRRFRALRPQTPLDPLALVCHQLHSETTETLFKANTLVFRREQYRGFKLFLQNAQPRILNAVRDLKIGVNLMPNVDELEDFMKKMPRAFMTITVSDWTFKTGRLHSNAPRGFRYGKNLEAQIKAMDGGGAEKRWRAFPAKLKKIEDLEVLRKGPDCDRVRRVLGWYDNGL